MSRHQASRRRNYARRQHQLRERPQRWQAVMRGWELDEFEAPAGPAFDPADDNWQPADVGRPSR